MNRHERLRAYIGDAIATSSYRRSKETATYASLSTGSKASRHRPKTGLHSSIGAPSLVADGPTCSRGEHARSGTYTTTQKRGSIARNRNNSDIMASISPPKYSASIDFADSRSAIHLCVRAIN